MEKSSGIDNLLREHGMCGELSPDRERACIKDAGHSRAHGWEDKRKLLDNLSLLCERQVDQFGDLTAWEVEKLARLVFPYD